MPNISQKKRKLLYLWKILFEKTDSSHALTLPQIQEELESLGIPAERKSLYDDIETLRSFGAEIRTQKGKTFQYFIADRTFSFGELCRIRDALVMSRDIPQKQKTEILQKLETLCSVYEGAELRELPSFLSQVNDREDSFLASLDAIRRAIIENRQIAFYPLEWGLSSDRKPVRGKKKGEKLLKVSPWKLLGHGDDQEVLAYLSDEKKLRRFRVDSISLPEILSENREGGESAAAAEAAGMGGPREKLVLDFPGKHLGRVAQRFGGAFTAEPMGKNKLRATVRTELTPEFFAWLFEQGTEIRIVSPKKVAERFREHAKSVAKLYKS